MQTFILLCFDKKAVVYSVKGESVQECRFRGNETLSLEWGDERFAEVWEYFEDVYDISSWENTEILIYCVNKKEVSLWDKVRYPVSQNVKGVTIEKIAQVLPKLAMAKGLLKKEYIVFSWRNHTWKVMRDFCEPCEDKAEYEVSDFDFAEFINRFLIVKSRQCSEFVVSLQAELLENQKRLKESEKTKEEYRNKAEKLQEAVNETKCYTEFIKTQDIALINPLYRHEIIKTENFIEWSNNCLTAVKDFAKRIAEEFKKDRPNMPVLNFPQRPQDMPDMEDVQTFCIMVENMHKKYLSFDWEGPTAWKDFFHPMKNPLSLLNSDGPFGLLSPDNLFYQLARFDVSLLKNIQYQTKMKEELIFKAKAIVEDYSKLEAQFLSLTKKINQTGIEQFTAARLILKKMSS